ncbi:MAG: hypothetical protein ACLQBK_11870 [Candidatus Sulfotelmatobacter sp.]
MRIHRITPTAVIALVAIVASAITARAEQPQVSLSADPILRGTAPTITITLGKSAKDIKSISVAGHVVDLPKSDTKGRVSVLLPRLDIVGRVGVEAIDKNGKSFPVGQLNYVEPAVTPSVPLVKPNNELYFLGGYVLLIALLPVVCTIFDMLMSYIERIVVLRSGRPVGDISSILASMDRGPTGFSGLTRGLVAMTLIFVLCFAIFHFIVFAKPELPDIAEKLLMLIAGTLTAITGFYFGSKTATDAARQQTAADAAKTVDAEVPMISNVNWDLTTKQLKVIGAGFGEPKGKAALKIKKVDVPVQKSDWTDKEIKVTVSAIVKGDDVVVTNDNGKSSDPWKMP